MWLPDDSSSSGFIVIVVLLAVVLSRMVLCFLLEGLGGILRVKFSREVDEKGRFLSRQVGRIGILFKSELSI